MWLQVPFEVSHNLKDKGRLFQTMGPETEKTLSLQIWFLFVEECSPSLGIEIGQDM